MRYGLDCLDPPTNAQAQLMRRLGWSWLNAYVGGPYLSGHTPWPNTRLNELASFGFRFLPLYVGQQLTSGMTGVLTYEQGLLDGLEALDCIGVAGFVDSPIVGLDLEAGNPIPESREYVRGWVQRVNANGQQAVLYSDATTAHYVGTPDLVDLIWVADWVVHDLRRAPFGRFDPAADPPWDAWQFGGGIVSGVPVDYDSCTDDFPLAVRHA